MFLNGQVSGTKGEQANRTAVPSCVPILAYHAIIEQDREPLPPQWSAEHAVSLDQFRKHLDILVAEGWNAILPEALEQASLPPKSVVITFDDGHCSDVIAARELTQRGLPATFFVTWTRLDCSGFLSRHQVVELEGQGFQIGSHGLAHVPLAELSSEEIRRQLIDSKRRLESLLDTAVNRLAVPFGSYNDQVVAGAVAAGYRAMLTSDFALAIAGSYLLSRLPVHARTTLNDFRALLSGRWLGLLRQHLANGIRRRILRCREMAGCALRS